MLRQGKALTILLLLVLSASTLTTIEFIGPTKANPLPIPENVPMEHAYIKSNGDIEPPTLPIQRSDNLYVLTGNILNYSIEIQKDNIIIDGNGYSLIVPPYDNTNGRPKTGDPTIQISSKNNIIIKNTRFQDCFTGISAKNSSNLTIIQNIMTNGLGISMTSCSTCSIIGNEITNAGVGLGISNSTFLNIIYNKISGNRYIAASVAITYSNITRNEVVDNLETGLLLHSSNSHNRIFENNFVNNQIGLLYKGYLNISSNDSVFSNYWSSNQVAIKNVDDGGMPYAQSSIDQSPLANPISTSLDPPLFPSPSPAPTFPPTPATTPPANPPTPTTTTSPNPKPTPNSTPTPTPNTSPTQIHTSTTTPTPTPNPTPDSTQSPTPTTSPSNSPTQQLTLEPTQSAEPTDVPIVDGVGPFSYVIGIVAVVIVAVAVSFAIYFKGLGKNQQKNCASKNNKTTLITQYTRSIMWVERDHGKVY